LKNRKTDFVFVEAESRRVGNIIIPDYIYKGMVDGVHILVDADLDFRAKVIVEEYTKGENALEEILNSLELLRKYISDKNIELYKNKVRDGMFEEVAKELMIKYYDPMYVNSIEKYNYDLHLQISDIEKDCEFLKKWVEQYIY
jgi:tRNA 2-selenouridine synthase